MTIAKPFAVAKFELTFDEWDACAAHGDCAQHVSDNGWGRGRRPVINVSWDDAQTYVKWLSRITGKHYRLLSEAEYEYAARAGTETKYPWGDDIKLERQADGQLQWLRQPMGRQANGAGWLLPREPRSVSTTWSATSGSGRRIAGTTVTRERRPTARHGRAAIATPASSAAVPGDDSPTPPLGGPPRVGTVVRDSDLGFRVARTLTIRADAKQTRRVNAKRKSPSAYIGGTRPSLPTSTKAASIEPSSCFGPRAMIAAPGLRSV